MNSLVLASLSLPNLVSRLPGGVAQGIIWGIMALGVYITFRILNLPDLTVDGSFTFGMAISTVLCAAAHPFAGLLAGALAGAVAGVVTGFLQTHCKIHPILAGILTMSGLYTVNITVLGGPNVSLLDAPKFFEVLGGKAPAVGLATVVVVVLVTLFFQTVGGLCIRAAGSTRTWCAPPPSTRRQSAGRRLRWRMRWSRSRARSSPSVRALVTSAPAAA